MDGWVEGWMGGTGYGWVLVGGGVSAGLLVAGHRRLLAAACGGEKRKIYKRAGKMRSNHTHAYPWMHAQCLGRCCFPPERNVR